VVQAVGTAFATSISDDRPAAGGSYEANNDELLDPKRSYWLQIFGLSKTPLFYYSTGGWAA